MKIAEDALPETQSELRWRPGCHTGVVGLQRMMRPVSEACLSWIFLYCLAGQAAIKSLLSAVRLKCKEVDAAAHFAALSRGAAPTARGECGGACMSWVLLWREARLSPIHQTHVYLGLGGRAGNELSILPLTVCSCRHLLLCRHQALAHGHKPPELHAATKKRTRETCAHTNGPHQGACGRSQLCLHI